ncbi:hypothetical protein ABTO69_20175, partial [Acinetobacter baumannii]
CILAGMLSFPHNLAILAAKGYPRWVAIAASIVTGISSPFCFGIIGLAIMQQSAIHELAKYGFKPGFLMTKRKFLKFVEDRIALENAPAPVFEVPEA